MTDEITPLRRHIGEAIEEAKRKGAELLAAGGAHRAAGRLMRAAQATRAAGRYDRLAAVLEHAYEAADAIEKGEG